MKIPKEISSYCPFCIKHTKGKVKEASKGKRRTLSKGQVRHTLKTKGYTSKVAGKTPINKQSKRVKMMITCKECGKKHEKMYPRTKKKIEIQRN